ncbi:hypothetical protein J132_11047 [Termitomyces sp. J132]|nr:hypothetical protein J132_11047 [Termitomyces sp. J132]
MPPTSSVSTARGRQPLVNVTSSTASTRAKVSASTTKGSSRSASGTLKAGQRTTVPKAPGKNLKSTGTRSDTMLSSTEATPAPNAHISDPTSMPVPKESTDAPKKPTPKTESTDLPKEATDLSSSMTNPKPSGPPPPKPQNIDKPKLTAPVPTSDPLQVAAQLYPWLYMTSTLDACFKSAEQTAKAHLETRAQQITESESELADQKTRFQAERAAELFDALSTDAVETAPRIMQAFLAHGEACERVEAEALQLALNPVKTSTGEDEEDEDWDAPLRVFAKMLDTLDQLEAEALELETSIVKLTTSLEPPLSDSGVSKDMMHDKTAELNADTESGAQAQILGVFKACIPVLRARIANLAMAQELVDGARENTSISLRMESLGLLD